MSRNQLRLYQALASIVQVIESEKYHSTSLADVSGWDADHEQARRLLEEVRRVAETALIRSESEPAQ